MLAGVAVSSLHVLVVTVAAKAFCFGRRRCGFVFHSCEPGVTLNSAAIIAQHAL